jgi:hypothetical protein
MIMSVFVVKKWRKGCRQEPPRFFSRWVWCGRLLPAVVTASGVFGIKMPGAVTGVLLGLRRLDFIAAARGELAGEEEK